MTIYGILCHIRRKNKVLLQFKSKGLWGEGRWNGPGGKIKKDEDPKKAAVREVFEETGLKIKNLKSHGEITYIYGKRNPTIWIVSLFSTSSFSGKPHKNHREGELRWFPQDKIPYEKMWGDDIYWWPLMLEGKKFQGKFWFNKKGDKLLAHEVKIL